MWRRTMAARAVVAGVAAAGVLAGGGTVAAASATIPTCTVTAIRLVASPASAEPGVELLTAGGFSGCFGTYVFYGVTPKGLGYPNVTTDNYAELAAVLKHWNSIDGVPAVSEWVNLSPAVAAGMKAAGVNPTMFLQWVNENDGGAPWPPFLPKPSPLDPQTMPQVGNIPGQVSPPEIVGAAAADQTVAAPKATPPPQAAPQQPVTPTQAPAPKPAAAPSTARSTGAGTGSRPASASGATATAKPASGAATAKPAKPVAKPALRPGAPPTVAAAGQTTVPCVVAPTCRQAVEAHDRWLRLPWYRRAALQLWWHRWWEVGGLAILAAAALAARAAIIGRRNLAWYGNVRGPR